MKPQIRRIVIQIEEIHNEIGKTIDPPARKATVAAIIKNPYAGKYVENLEPLYDMGAEIGGLLAKKAVVAMDVEPAAIVSYGKGTIVGLDGEMNMLQQSCIHDLANRFVRQLKRAMI